MKPGHNLDLLVHEKVFGKPITEIEHDFTSDQLSSGLCRRCDTYNQGALLEPKYCSTPPPYSTDNGWVMKIVEKMRTSPMGWSFSINIAWDGMVDVYMSAGDCNCPHNKEYDPADKHGYSSAQSECESVPFAHAICLAALRALKAIPDMHCLLCSSECPCTDRTCAKECKTCIPTCKEKSTEKSR